MKITFDLSTKDYLKFYKNNLKKNNILFRPSIFIFGMIISLLLTLTYKANYVRINSVELANKTLSFIINVVVLYGFIIGLIFFSRAISVNRLKRQIKENPFIIGHHELELIGNRLILKSKSATTEFLKDSFILLEETSEYLYLYRGKHSALIIPKSGINNESEQIKKWMTK
jgi:uncharacterized membrane protein (DUF485 family)